MKRFIHGAVRCLGVLAGLLFLTIAPLVLWEERTFSAAMFLVTALTMGGAFLWYGLTGRQPKPNFPPALHTPLRVLAGVMFIAYGIHLLIKRQWSIFGIVTCLAFLLLGCSSLWMAYVLRKPQRAA